MTGAAAPAAFPLKTRSLLSDPIPPRPANPSATPAWGVWMLVDRSVDKSSKLRLGKGRMASWHCCLITTQLRKLFKFIHLPLLVGFRFALDSLDP